MEDEEEEEEARSWLILPACGQLSIQSGWCAYLGRGDLWRGRGELPTSQCSSTSAWNLISRGREITGHCSCPNNRTQMWTNMSSDPTDSSFLPCICRLHSLPKILSRHPPLPRVTELNRPSWHTSSRALQWMAEQSHSANEEHNMHILLSTSICSINAGVRWHGIVKTSI